MSAPPFPKTEDGDSDDVTWALETGRSMWVQGEFQDALRWLKRASETASEEGDDMRSLTLAMAAAELRTHCADEAQAAAAAAPPTTMVLDDDPPQQASTHLLEAVAEAKALAQQKHQPAATPLPAASQPAATPPPAASQPAVVEADSLHDIPIPKEDEDDEGPTLIATKTHRKRTTDLIKQFEKAEPPVQPAPKPAAAKPATAKPAELARHDAVRVAVQPVEGQPDAYYIRPLKAGERPDAGARTALLVALEPAKPLF